jgi:putative heme transporter
VAVAVLVLRTRLPRPAAIVDALHAANPVWLAVAVLAEIVSMDMFARQQRQLLRAFGVRMSQPRAVALTYSRSAITYAVPAGSAVSAGFAYTEFRARGASRSAATTVTVLSGVASTIGLFTMYATGALGSAAPDLLRRVLPGIAPLSVSGLLVEAGGVFVVVGVAVLMSRAVRRRAAVPQAALAQADVARPLPPTREAATGRSPLARAWAAAGQALREARAVPRGHWYAAVALAALNWLADLICLVAVAHALHLPLGMLTLSTAYLAVQVVRQVPVTPGGIGLVETSLLAALVSAGAGQVPAAAVVLGYRLLSCWLVIPIGLLAWLGLRRPSRAAAHRVHRPVRIVHDGRFSGSTCARGSYASRTDSRPPSYMRASRRRATRSL